MGLEEYLLNNSEIIKEAVESDKLYIAKCHFDHNTGEVTLLYNENFPLTKAGRKFVYMWILTDFGRKGKSSDF